MQRPNHTPIRKPSLSPRNAPLPRCIGWSIPPRRLSHEAESLPSRASFIALRAVRSTAPCAGRGWRSRWRATAATRLIQDRQRSPVTAHLEIGPDSPRVGVGGFRGRLSGSRGVACRGRPVSTGTAFGGPGRGREAGQRTGRGRCRADTDDQPAGCRTPPPGWGSSAPVVTLARQVTVEPPMACSRAAATLLAGKCEAFLIRRRGDAPARVGH